MTGSGQVRLFHAELAWLAGERPDADVLIEVHDGVIVDVIPGRRCPRDAIPLTGLTLPGLVNTHSHVFHRALRGNSESGFADFWAWRAQMYAIAECLTPELLYRIARATYAEMALAGITTVGEFHYVHHQADGTLYDDPNAMGHAVMRAAADAGIRITLLDTCYLQADVSGSPLAGVQRRFDDGSWQQWAARVALVSDGPTARVGAAIHSIRAVPRSALGPVAIVAAEWAAPLHVHLSEQPAENEACMKAYGMTPTAVLAAEGVWGGRTTAVHATHLTDSDIATLGRSGSTISMCCTTERDLADGVGPAIKLARAGSPLVVGSDGHMCIDLLEEGRAIELDERLISGQRGHLRVDEILTALTAAGADSLGWAAGRIADGALADLTTIRLDSPRTAGARSGDVLAHVVFAATAADIQHVVMDGRTIVEGGQHVAIADVGRELEGAIEAVRSASAAPAMTRRTS